MKSHQQQSELKVSTSSTNNSTHHLQTIPRAPQVPNSPLLSRFASSKFCVDQQIAPSDLNNRLSEQRYKLELQEAELKLAELEARQEQLSSNVLVDTNCPHYIYTKENNNNQLDSLELPNRHQTIISSLEDNKLKTQQQQQQHTTTYQRYRNRRVASAAELDNYISLPNNSCSNQSSFLQPSNRSQLLSCGSSISLGTSQDRFLQLSQRSHLSNYNQPQNHHYQLPLLPILPHEIETNHLGRSLPTSPFIALTKSTSDWYQTNPNQTMSTYQTTYSAPLQQAIGKLKSHRLAINFSDNQEILQNQDYESINSANQHMSLLSKPTNSRFCFDELDLRQLERQNEEVGLSVVPSVAYEKMPHSVAVEMKQEARDFVKKCKARDRCKVRVRRTLLVKVPKSKPLLGIAIEGGFDVSGQLLPRVVCVHEEGAAYECGQLKPGDLILQVDGQSTVNLEHDEIANLIAGAYYVSSAPFIELLIGEGEPDLPI